MLKRHIFEKLDFKEVSNHSSLVQTTRTTKKSEVVLIEAPSEDACELDERQTLFRQGFQIVQS